MDGRQSPLNRREMLMISAASVWSLLPSGRSSDCDVPMRNGVPAVDYHAHIGEGITVDGAIAIARRLGLRFGLVQHAGTPGHGFAISDDESLKAWTRLLDGKPVFKAMEVETTDWVLAFSPAVVAKLDYVQADCLGLPDESGAPLQIWRPEFRPSDAQSFMDRYVDFHVQRISAEPLDILVVPTLLPTSLAADYDRLWTTRRTDAVIDAAVKHNVALEIDCRFRVPKRGFLEAAKGAGVKFAFGSNYQTAEGLGDISYCVRMYRRLGLAIRDFFCPAPPGRKPIELR